MRYRKFTLLNIKDSNPLFAQMKVETPDLISNLRLLIQKVSLTLASSVTMEDLKEAIENSDPVNEGEHAVNKEGIPDYLNDETVPEIEFVKNTNTDFVVRQPVSSTLESIGPVIWPPSVGTYIAVNFEDGFYIGEVVSPALGTKVRVDYMHPKVISTVDDARDRRFCTFTT